MYDENFNSRLLLVIEKIGGLKKVVEELNFSYATIDRWRKGVSDPKVSNIIKLCEVANVSIDWLMLGEDKKINTDKNMDNVEINKKFDEFVLIKGYNIQASAGLGVINWDSETPTRYLAFRKTWIKFKGFYPNKLIAIFVKGDSMFPTINDNDTILINRASNTLIDGKIYVIRLGEQILVKRLQGLPNGVRLISDNKIYDSLDIVKPDLSNLEVIGEVVHVSHDL